MRLLRPHLSPAPLADATRPNRSRKHEIKRGLMHGLCRGAIFEPGPGCSTVFL